MNLMLVIVLLIFFAYTYQGSKIGLVKMMFYLTSSLVLIFVSFIISPIISREMVKNPAVVHYVEDKLDSAFEKYEQIKKESGKKPDTKEIAFQGISRWVGKEYLVPLVIKSVSFLIVYVIAGLILMMIEKTLCLIARLPVLSSLNRLAGAGVGALKGLIIVWLLFMVMTIFMDKEIAARGLKQIGENPILAALYDNNLIVKLIEGFMK